MTQLEIVFKKKFSKYKNSTKRMKQNIPHAENIVETAMKTSHTTDYTFVRCV